MSWEMALMMLGSAGLQAGGAAAGAAGQQMRSPASTPAYNPATAPLLALASLNQLAQFGVFDPSLVDIAGPQDRAIQALRAQGVAGGFGDLGGQGRLDNTVRAINSASSFVERARTEGFTIGELGKKGTGDKARLVDREIETGVPAKISLPGKKARQAIRDLGYTIGDRISAEEAAAMSTDDLLTLSGQNKLDKRAQRMFASSGFGSVGDLIDAELEFGNALTGALGQVEGRATRSREQAELAQQQLFDLLSSGAADVDQLREDELARQRIFTDEFRQNAIREANFGGFNPAGGLERAAELEETSQNAALQRAVGLLSGATTSANLLNALDPTSAATAFAPAMSAARTPMILGQPGPGPAIGQSPWAAAAPGIGNAFASGLNNYMLGDLYQQDIASRRDLGNPAPPPATSGPPSG